MFLYTLYHYHYCCPRTHNTFLSKNINFTFQQLPKLFDLHNMNYIRIQIILNENCEDSTFKIFTSIHAIIILFRDW